MTMVYPTNASPRPPSRVPLARPWASRGRPSIDIEQMRAAWVTAERLFCALQGGDADALIRFYEPDADFYHPLLGRLRGAQIGSAWRSFLALTPDFGITFRIEQVGPGAAEVSWRQTYRFHLTARPIVITGTSQFLLRRQGAEVLIAQQIDRCDRRLWSRQALGLKGFVLSFLPGWRTFVENELRLTLDVPHHGG